MPLNLGERRVKWKSHNRVWWTTGATEAYFYQAPRDRASGTNRNTDVLAEGQRGETQGPSPGSVTAEGGVWMQSITLTWYLLVREEHRNPAWGLWQPGLWRLEAGTRVLQPLPGSTNGQEECSWATHCCLLAREEEGSDPVMHGSPLSFSWDPETEKSLLYWCFGYGTILTTHNNKILHIGPPPGDGEVTHHLWRAVSSISRLPVSGPLSPLTRTTRVDIALIFQNTLL